MCNFSEYTHVVTHVLHVKHVEDLGKSVELVSHVLTTYKCTSTILCAITHNTCEKRLSNSKIHCICDHVGVTRDVLLLVTGYFSFVNKRELMIITSCCV